ncbi:alpha/beta hydrolase [Phanerochaete sordida]|uniref:Alpha/beta hydrolase n=1 Tax=Phanerochaete sordida TaxID=48140 RepID=A0A9P3GPW7_9APHY|nr:alpha/beta hydrolase [Phanerochaete sordida]
MYTTTLHCEAFVFDPRPRYPLLITAKRYWHPAHCSTAPDALTLVLAHGTGFHKEHWEPTLDELYALLGGTANSGINIREAWSIECPNHGDAAVLNEDALMWGYTPTFSWEEYARSVHAVLAGLGTGIDVDFSSRRLIGVGHSMGAIALMLADVYLPQLAFASLILVDPMLVPKPLPGKPDFDLASPAARRRDIWASTADALASLRARPSFAAWDPRILELYVAHGLRALPTAAYPDKTGVTLKCTREQETACYRSDVGRVRAYHYLHELCVRVPVHIIYGAINDYLPESVHQDVLQNAARGKYATVARVAEAGHLIPQMQPKGLADAIFAAMKHDVSTGFTPRSSPASRL